MRPAADSAREIDLDDRGSLARRDVNESDLPATAVADDRPPSGSAYVVHPRGSLAEHRDEVALSVVIGDHERDGGDAPGSMTGRFERDRPGGTYPESEDRGIGATDDSTCAVRTPVPVEEPIAVAVRVAAQVEQVGACGPERRGKEET